MLSEVAIKQRANIVNGPNLDIRSVVAIKFPSRLRKHRCCIFSCSFLFDCYKKRIFTLAHGPPNAGTLQCEATTGIAGESYEDTRITDRTTFLFSSRCCANTKQILLAFLAFKKL